MFREDREAFNRMSAAFGRMSDTMNAVLENEKASRDRVDISLAEYERLKAENKRLELEAMQLRVILGRIDFPTDVYENVRTDSISVHYSEDPMRFVRRYRIEFEVENY